MSLRQGIKKGLAVLAALAVTVSGLPVMSASAEESGSLNLPDLEVCVNGKLVKTIPGSWMEQNVEKTPQIFSYATRKTGGYSAYGSAKGVSFEAVLKQAGVIKESIEELEGDQFIFYAADASNDGVQTTSSSPLTYEQLTNGTKVMNADRSAAVSDMEVRPMLAVSFHDYKSCSADSIKSYETAMADYAILKGGEGTLAMDLSSAASAYMFIGGQTGKNDSAVADTSQDLTGKNRIKNTTRINVITADPTTITLNQETLTFHNTTAQKLTATVAPSGAMQDVNWFSSNPKIASVDANGTVKPVSAGTCTITAIPKEEKYRPYAKCTVTVNFPTSVSLDKAALTFKSGTSQKLTATVLPADTQTKDIIWKSSNPKVATVDAAGNVKPKGYGSCKITATTKAGGCVASSSVKVYVPNTPKITKTAVTYNSAKLTWSKVSGANGYVVYQATSKNGKYTAVKTLTSASTTSYTKGSLKTGQTYYYKVRAYGTASGSKVYGNYSAVKSAKPVLGKTTLSSVSNVKGKKAKVTWKKVTGASGYVVYRATSKNGKYQAVKTLKGTSFTNTKLGKNKTYYYKVRAYRTVSGKKVYGGYSSVKQVKIKK